MNTLLHPATAFIQALPYNEVAFGDMTPDQQRAVWEYMDCGGDGVWAANIGSLDGAKLMYSDVRFCVGAFPNDEVFKIAMFAAIDDGDEAYTEEAFQNRFACDATSSKPQPPVVLSRADNAPEFGLFEWGYEWFYDYWVKQPETQFVSFLPDWNPNDDSGRGGQ